MKEYLMTLQTKLKKTYRVKEKKERKEMFYLTMHLMDFIYGYITYEEQHNKGHIYHTISQVCHNKIDCPLGNFKEYILF